MKDLSTYLHAALAILAGRIIGLCCRLRTDRALWQQRLRAWRLAKRRLDHRKVFFRTPSQRGETIAPLIECLGVVLIALFFAAVVLGFCANEPRW